MLFLFFLGCSDYGCGGECSSSYDAEATNATGTNTVIVNCLNNCAGNLDPETNCTSCRRGYYMDSTNSNCVSKK